MSRPARTSLVTAAAASALALAAITGTAALASGTASVAGDPPKSTATASPTPTPTAPAEQPYCGLEKFTSAKLKVVKGRPVLVLKGVASHTSISVGVVPLVYVQQPEYWGLQVVGCSPQNVGPAMTPWHYRFDVSSTLGTKGVEVISKDRIVRLDFAKKG